MTDELIEVTQADIDAVKRFHAESARWMLDAIKSGDPIGEERDLNHPIYQAFARHRIAATDTQVSKHSELEFYARELLVQCDEIARTQGWPDNMQRDQLRAMLTPKPLSEITPEWCLKMAKQEGDSDIAAGLLARDPDAQVSNLVCALERIIADYENQNIGHEQFRVLAKRVAIESLAALEGMGEKA